MKLIDVDTLRKPIYAEDDNVTGFGMTYGEMNAYNDGVDAAWSRIDNAPTVDAVPVVRCKDCVHCFDGLYSTECEKWGIYEACGLVNEDWWCCHGERREDD